MPATHSFTPLGPDQKRILVLCGNEAPGIAAANVYADLFQDRELVFIEERTVSPGRILSFSRRRLRRKGFISLLDSYAYYVQQWVQQGLRQGLQQLLRKLRPSAASFAASAAPAKTYQPLFCVNNLSTDSKVRAFLAGFKPDVVITAHCGLLSPDFLACLAAPVYNTHPGINPRYRGFGNFWAYHENTPSLVGYTIHKVDEGADTGERIAVERVNLDGLAFDNIESHVYALAAEKLAALLLGRDKPGIPEEFCNLASVYYGVPTLSAHLRAKRNFERTHYRKGPDMPDMHETSEKEPRAARHIVITGASGGIGQALAQEYADPGVAFTLLGRDAQRLEETRNICTNRGAVARCLSLDLRDEDAARNMVAELCAGQTVDMVFVNAGVSSGTLPDGTLENATDASRTMQINASASINLCAAFLERMQQWGQGHVICTSSIAAIYPLPDSPAYSASKIAVAWYAKAMKAALHGTGIRVSVIYPGYVVSPMSKRLAGPQPMLWTAEKAARHIRERLDAGSDAIFFPKLLAFGAFLLHLLPVPLAVFFLKRFGFTIQPDSGSGAHG